MKTIQITMDEALLARLDANEETARIGRSALLRRAVAEYLDRRQRAAISSGYQRAYADNAGLGQDFRGWEDEGSWPIE